MNEITSIMKGFTFGSVIFAVIWFIFWLKGQNRIKARLIELEMENERREIADKIDNMPLVELVNHSNKHHQS